MQGHPLVYGLLLVVQDFCGALPQACALAEEEAVPPVYNYVIPHLTDAYREVVLIVS